MYAKVFSQIYDGTLCTKGQWQALVTFQQMLVLADPDGNVDMTAGAISRRTTIPLEIIEAGIAVLTQPDPESRTPDEEGRRLVPLAEGRSWGWRVVNYKRYRALKREEDRREYHREYWHRRKLNNSTETQHAQPNQPRQETVDKRQETASPSEKKPRSRASRPQCPSDVDSKVWESWLELRKAKRAPVTETTVDGARAEAEKAGMTLEAFLRVWCTRGSQGLDASWLKPSEKAQAASQPAPSESPADYMARQKREREAEAARVAAPPEAVREKLTALAGKLRA